MAAIVAAVDNAVPPATNKIVSVLATVPSCVEGRGVGLAAGGDEFAVCSASSPALLRAFVDPVASLPDAVFSDSIITILPLACFSRACPPSLALTVSPATSFCGLVTS